MTDAAFLEPELIVEAPAQLTRHRVRQTVADADHLTPGIRSHSILRRSPMPRVCPAVFGRRITGAAAPGRKAFRPGRFRSAAHIDTGHNFPEVIEFRDHRAAQLVNATSCARSGSIAAVASFARAGKSRNRHQSVTLLDAP
jgi:hypothetical protein